MNTDLHYDLLLLADCHAGRARAQDLAEEIRAQAAAGFTSGIIDVGSRAKAAFMEAIRGCVREGLVEMLPWNARVKARALLVYSPAGVAAGPLPPQIEADRVIVIVEEPTPDLADPMDLGTLAGVAQGLAQTIRPAPSYAPRGPIAREAIERAGLPLHEDWPPVLDVGAFHIERESIRRPAVIGRIAPVHQGGWPRTRDELLAAYPDGGEHRVRILGNVGRAIRTLGKPPGAWTVFPPGSRWRSDLLASVDAYVCQPDPDEQLSPGRSVLEAIASGAIAIGPARFRDTLGDAISAVEPRETLEKLEKLTADPAALEDRVRSAREYVRARFDQQAHGARIARLIGPASSSPSPQPARPQPSKRRVLFVSSNGAGVGHLMRLMSIARRMGPDIEPIFFTLSQAVPAVREMGFPVEYLVSHHYARLPGSLWHPQLRRRLDMLLDLYRPSAVVFDGTAPYRGLMHAMARRPDVPLVWSRRAMWKPGLGERAIEFSEAFHLILEPGDFAEERDGGATVAARTGVTRTLPVLLHEPDELLEREQARRELGLDPRRPAALVQLGAGNINDIASTVSIVVRRLAEESDLQVCVAASIIGTRGAPVFERVKRISVYPLARYLHAFDFAVSASGYNTYHELIAAGVPSIFIPNLETALDDQQTRAAFAADVGVGLSLPLVDEETFSECVSVMLDPQRRAAMAARCAELFPGNGAGQASAAIRTFIEAWEDHGIGLRAGAPSRRRPRRQRREDRPWRDRAGRLSDRILTRYAPRFRKDLRRRTRLARLVLAGDERAAARAQSIPVNPGPEIDPVDAALLPVVMILSWQPTELALAELVARVEQVQRSRLTFKPLFVTDSDAFAIFRHHGYQFEFVMPRDLWEKLDHPLTWEEYRSQRLSQLMRDYAPQWTVTARTAAELDPGLLAAAIEPIG
ncbi:MAG TPA: glycosyltransferase [Actinomycetota bacterium]